VHVPEMNPVTAFVSDERMKEMNETKKKTKLPARPSEYGNSWQYKVKQFFSSFFFILHSHKRFNNGNKTLQHRQNEENSSVKS
jgi:hypothetical protein